MLGLLATDLFSHHIDAFGVADASGLGDHGDVLLAGLLQEAHPKPAADLAGEGRHDPQGRFIGFQQGIHQGNGIGRLASEQGIAHGQAVGGVAGHQGCDRCGRDCLGLALGIAAHVNREFLQFAGQPGAVAADRLRQGFGGRWP